MAKHTQKAVKKIHTEHGELNQAEYVYRGVTLHQQEISVKQQIAITPILLDAGIEGVTSFDDVASINVEFLASRLLARGKATEFMLIVLKRADGNELTAEFLEEAPATPYNDLFADVMRDFFFSNPSLLRSVVIPYAQSRMQEEMMSRMKSLYIDSAVGDLKGDPRFSQLLAG